MRVLLVHNHYVAPGGEDAVFAAERDLLAARGHDVASLELRTGDALARSRASLAVDAVWSRRAGRRVADLIARHRPAVVHFHNTFPLVSPAAYYACRAAGVPVVQTLHNYRLICPAATCYRAGRPCGECVSRSFAWPAVMHGCYRGRSASAVAGVMLAAHRAIGTWSSAVDLYIALTSFARTEFVRGGLPPERIVVKPNFLPRDPGPGLHDGDYALFVGRVAGEKGLDTLLDVWRRTAPPIRLVVAGTGPDEARLRAAGVPGIEWRGWQPPEAVGELMQRARLLLLPSRWYEGFPITLLEAFAAGLPVIGSRIGAIAELVEHRVTGLLADAFDPDEWAAALAWALDNPSDLRRIGDRGRERYVDAYGPDTAYEALIGAYERVARRPPVGTTC